MPSCLWPVPPCCFEAGYGPASVPSECLADNAVNASTSNCIIVGAGSCGWGPINFYVTLSGEGGRPGVILCDRGGGVGRALRNA